MSGSIFLSRAVPELIQGLTEGSCSAVDLADATARAISTRESATHAWVCYDLAQLRAEAVQAQNRLMTRGQVLGLEGIPFGVKDIFNTRTFPTEMGSPIWKDFTPGNNARVVDSLVFAGALVAGKTVTAEFAVHALNETLNPHDATRTPGTSSSGSAAAVATGMVPFALGTQTAGSIVRPASFCGIWGMKPSFGMIPRTGGLKTTDSLDTIGFLAAHAQSLRPILDQARVRGPNYPYVFRHVDRPGERPKRPDRPWRVGLVRTHTWAGAAAYARDAVVGLAEKIGREPGFELIEMSWPEELREVHEIHATIYTKSLSYYFQTEAKLSVRISPVMKEMMTAGEAISVAKFSAALRRQEELARKLDELLAPFDVVLSLGTSSSAPPRGEVEIPDPSLIWTLGHVPAVAAPTFRAPDGLPFGAQFVSRKWNDYLLLQAVEELVNRGVLPGGSQVIQPGSARP